MMSRSIERLLPDVIEAIYVAGADPAQWQRVADMCSEAVPGSAFSQVVAVPGRVPIAIPAGWDEGYLKTYTAHYHTINPYPTLLARIPPGQVVLASKVVSSRWLDHQAFYHEWLKPAGNYTSGASLTLEQHASTCTRLSFDIPEAYRRWEKKAGEILRLASPHIARSLDLHTKYNETLASGVSQALIELIDDAAFVVDQSAVVKAMNARAETLVKSDISVAMRAKRLLFQHVRADQAFRAALHSCISTALTIAPHVFRLTDAALNARVVVLPLRNTASGGLVGSSRPLALVLIERKQRHGGLANTILQSLYCLTAAERRMALGIAQGRSLAEVAEQFGIARTTARNQLASAMRKLDVNRQSELAALVAQLVPRLGMSKDH